MADKHDGLDAFRRPFDRDGVVINGKKADARVTQAITAASVTLTMLGCSSLKLSISDPDYWLTRESGVLGQKAFRATVELQGLSWTIAQIDKTLDGYDIDCIPTAAAKLKRHSGPWKTVRDRLTRADSVAALCGLADAPFANHPWVNVKQPIESFTREEQGTLDDATASEAAQGRTRRRIARGALNGKGITIKGAKADREQLRNLETILAVADALGVTTVVRQAAIVAAIGESGVRAIPNQAGSGYAGVFQALPANIPMDDTEQQARYFFRGGKGFQQGGAIVLSKRRPEMSPGTIATFVEAGGADPFFYDQHLPEAIQIIRAWSPGDNEQTDGELTALTGTPDRARIAKYEFRVEKHQSYWEASYQWASEVNWRFFLNIVPSITEGMVWFISDLDLAAADPSLVLSEGENGIDRILWSRTAKGRIDEINVDCRLESWTGLPGQVAIVEGEGEPADGRYLIHQIERDLLDTEGAAQVTLGKPQNPKPEPKPGIITIPGTGPAVDDSTPAGQEAHVAAAYAKAVEIDKQHYGYTYGGGHANFKGPYDCSGFVSAVLNAAGLGVDTPLDTVALGQWGKPGRGKLLTVWVRPLAGTLGHTWLWFEDKFTGRGIEIFEAGGIHGAKTGRRSSHSTDGYEPRHWEGT